MDAKFNFRNFAILLLFFCNVRICVCFFLVIVLFFLFSIYYIIYSFFAFFCNVRIYVFFIFIFLYFSLSMLFTLFFTFLLVNIFPFQSENSSSCLCLMNLLSLGCLRHPCSLDYSVVSFHHLYW